MMMLTIRASCIFAVLTKWLVVGDTTSSTNLLMLGNSFSEAHHLEETVAALLSERQTELKLGGGGVYADRFEHHSANLTDYLGAEVSKAIGQERKWTWVTLQEQSEIPGFYPPDDNDAREDMWDRSMETVLQLNQEIQEAGATTVLFQTWGYFKEDPLNKDIYTDYTEMQDHITKGYEYYYREILKKNSRSQVKIAPCGMAFSTIYHDLKDQGKDPLQEGSLFDLLYEKQENPRKHPSAQGAYLCACVLFQTLTGLDVRQSTPPTSVPLDSLTTKLLQDAAYRTMQTYGDAPPKQAKTYRPKGYKSSNHASGVFNFLFAFLLGGGMLAGWVGWKWHTAAGSVRTQVQPGGSFYQLADDAGDMMMELIGKNDHPPEPRWINPV